MALKIDGNVTIQNYVESGATLNITNIDHVDNFFASHEPKKKEVAAIEAIATEVAVVDGGLADYVRIPARQEEILSALHANIDGKKGRAVALVITCAIEEGLLNRPPFPVLEKEFGDIGSRQNYSKAINQGFTEVEKRRYQKLFAALKS